MDTVLNGLLGLSGNSEVNLDNLSDDQLDDVVEGLGRYRRNKRFKHARACVRKERARRAKRKHARKPTETKVSSGKMKFESRLNLIEDKAVVEAIRSGRTTQSDFEIYAIKKADSNHIEMFKPADSEIDGVTNLNKSELPSGNVMMIDTVTVLSGVNTAPTGNDIEDGKVVAYGKAHTNIVNGKFTFKNGEKTLIKTSSTQLFNHDKVYDKRVGEHQLDVPVMIQNGQRVIFDIDTSADLPADTYIMVRLRGVITKRN